MTEDIKFINDLDDILISIKKLLISKRKDYGLAFDKSHDKFGLISPIIRITDKIERLNHLIKNNIEPNNETIEDSFMDIIGYSILSLLQNRNKEDDYVQY